MAVYMTPPEIRAALTTIGWSARELGTRIGASPDYAAQMVRGTRPWPAALTPWLLTLALKHQNAPAPAWRTLGRRTK